MASVTAFDRESGKGCGRGWLICINADKRSARLSGGLVSRYGKLFLGSKSRVVYMEPDQRRSAVANFGAGEVVANPAVEDGRVVVLTTSGRLVALSIPMRQAAVDPGGRTAVDPAQRRRPHHHQRRRACTARADGKVGIALLSNGQPVRQSGRRPARCHRTGSDGGRGRQPADRRR